MISVIIPNYNSNKYLCDAVDSALLQKVEMEIVIVDDCSTDDSISILKKNLQDSHKVDVLDAVSDTIKDISADTIWQAIVDDTPLYILKNRENSGVAIARNNAISFAKGEYVALLDSDDMWVEGKLDEQLRLLEETQAVLCNTARKHIKADATPTDKVIATPEKITLKMLEKTNYINCSSVLVRRDVMLEFPMEHSEIHEDYLTWLKILKKYKQVVGINKSFLLYRLSETGKSRNKLKAAKMTYKTYRLAGYKRVKAIFMMIAYTYNGIKKHI